MNFWTPEFHVWGEGLDASDMPWYLMYDYVEVFTYDVEDNEFHLHWRDDFDSFNADRWHKASGGFDMNSSVFHPENVSVKAGHLVLKMEPANEEKEPIHHYRHSVDEEHILHKQDHFDRDHIRAHKESHDGKFWIDHDLRHENERNREDDIHLIDRHHHDDHHEKLYQLHDDETSDSDEDWEDYQRYLHAQPDHHKIVRVEEVEHTDDEDNTDSDSDREEYEEYRRTYKLWKEEQR